MSTCVYAVVNSCATASVAPPFSGEVHGHTGWGAVGREGDPGKQDEQPGGERQGRTGSMGHRAPPRRRGPWIHAGRRAERHAASRFLDSQHDLESLLNCCQRLTGFTWALTFPECVHICGRARAETLPTVTAPPALLGLSLVPFVRQ